MACALPTETDQLQIYRQFCANLTQAETLQAGIASCIAIVETWFAPAFCTIVWETSYGPRVRDPYPTALAHSPDANEILRLSKRRDHHPHHRRPPRRLLRPAPRTR